MSKVAILGSAFNPIGLHHQKMATVVREELEMPIWMMPCYQHRFSKNSELLSPHHRWHMLCLACEDSDYMWPFDWEIAHQHDGAMATTMQQVADRYSHDFHIIIGSDNANNIDQWFDWERLIESYPFIVLERPGHPLCVEWPKQKMHTVFPFGECMSSSAIRDAIEHGDYEFARKHLHPRVWDYVIANQLCGYGGTNHVVSDTLA